nr:MFS transporter [Sulfitobacter mediterraneus]
MYPWFKFFQNLVFWQAIWFLFFQKELSGAEAILLYAIYDVGTTAMEVPSGYMSDRLGRRRTLIASGLAASAGAELIAFGNGFAAFALAQVLLGAGAAFASGTDNAFLYESLAADGREDETEAQETRSWQFSLIGLALSAFTGGLMAQWGFGLAFAAGAAAQAACFVVALRFCEPPHEVNRTETAGPVFQARLFQSAMRVPVLVWLFTLSVLMYGFSHIPFVFGQPFIAEALRNIGLQGDAPMVSGGVSAIMMLTSALATLFALRLRRRFGLAALLMLAFGIQVGLIATLAVTNSIFAIGVLFLRMVPNSLSRPFIIARMQPLLSDAGRATFLSVQSFAGRLLFAGSLLLASVQVSDRAGMAYGDIRMTLGWYAVAGILCLVALLMTVRWAAVQPDAQAD